MNSVRISVTIPPDVLVEADRKAAELDRSRSWVVAEAVRRFATGVATVAAVREEPAAPYDASGEVQASRDRLLLAELALTPTERVLRSEQLAMLRERGRPRRTQIIAFETYDDYYDWKDQQRFRL
ncbi:MAG: ribbon-helix-helix domain-containing protein [Gemmatimonadales bacterium]